MSGAISRRRSAALVGNLDVEDVQRFPREFLVEGGYPPLDLERPPGPVRPVGLEQVPEPCYVPPQQVLDASLGRGIPPSEDVELQEGLPGVLFDEAQHDLLGRHETAQAELDPPVLRGPVEIRLPPGGGIAVDQVVGEVLVGAGRYTPPDLHIVAGGLQGGVDRLAQKTGGDRSLGGDPGDAGVDVPGFPVLPGLGDDLVGAEAVALPGGRGNRRQAEKGQRRQPGCRGVTRRACLRR